MKKINKSIDFAGKKLTLSGGDFAFQATGAVMVTCGETVAMATVVSSPLREDLGYFPLMVEYRVRLSAGGRIKGSRWVKREGRPTDDEILTARLIDRSIRPLFPKGYKKDVQVIVQVLSIDGETAPEFVGALAAVAAIEASSIPWEGPIALVRVGMKEKDLVVNPTSAELKEGGLDLIVSGTEKAIVMVEAGANEVSEENVLKGIILAKKEGKKLLSLIKDFAKDVGVEKEKVEGSKNDLDIEKKVLELAKDKFDSLAKDLATKDAGYSDYDEVKNAIKENFDEDSAGKAGQIFEELFAKNMKKMILSGKRPDGRKSDELRNLDAKVSVLPRVHGSAIFLRGQTQAMTVVTLGSSSLEQLIETAEGEEKKRYLHHYSMPPYSVGETGRYGFPSRRDIGHGALGERAIMPVIPSEEEFPYTIHVLTEILSSNGSTSMAATCASSLSLMDAGVPIKSPVAGIAMGLVIENDKKYKVLTDISGVEDGNGDMDFKVAGTAKGVTALQLDVKTLNLTAPILKEAFGQAKKARLTILEAMKKAISKPNSKISQYAPTIKTTSIPVEKIGELIGPGGKVIKKLMADTETQVDVDDTGLVSVSSTNSEGVKKAIEWIDLLVKEVQPGEIYKGKVTRIEQYGAFVEVLPQKDGLVHVSSMSEGFVKDPNSIVSLGDEVEVRVKKIDDMGRIDLSMILDPSKEKSDSRRDSRDSGSRNSGSRDRRSRNTGSRRFQNNRGGKKPGERSSGPHFPTSRLIEEKSR